MTTTTYRTTTREERRLLSNAVARLRIAGCRVGHVIGHDLERGRLHYSVNLPGDDTAAGAMRIRMGHGRALRSPGIRVWADPHDRGRLTFGSDDPALMFHTLQALADVVNRFLPTPEPVGDSREVHRAEVQAIIDRLDELAAAHADISTAPDVRTALVALRDEPRSGALS